MDQEGGIGKRRAAPILTRENHESWFKIIRMHLIKLKVEWVLEEMVLSTPASTLSKHISTTLLESLD